MQKVIEMLKAYLDERTAKPGEYSFAIGYGYDYEEACHFREMLKDLVRERLGVDESEIRSAWGLSNARTGKRRADRSRR